MKGTRFPDGTPMSSFPRAIDRLAPLKFCETFKRLDVPPMILCARCGGDPPFGPLPKHLSDVRCPHCEGHSWETIAERVERLPGPGNGDWKRRPQGRPRKAAVA